jgi:hypothetical protein
MKKTKNILKSLSKKTLLITLGILIGVSVSVFAAARIVKYNPGETLNPDCFPGETNCSVVTSVPTPPFDDSGILRRLDSLEKKSLDLETKGRYYLTLARENLNVSGGQSVYSPEAEITKGVYFVSHYYCNGQFSSSRGIVSGIEITEGIGDTGLTIYFKEGSIHSCGVYRNDILKITSDKAKVRLKWRGYSGGTITDKLSGKGAESAKLSKIF